jgi:hypothetical protein
MTREDIIRMAREAGFADGVVDIVGFEGFVNFANLVAAHERTWVGLTDEDRQELAAEQHSWEGLCSAVEAKLKEKNT